MILLPVATVFVLAYAVGRAPIGLKIGVVNNEVPGMMNYNFSAINDPENLSIRFLSEITDDKAQKVYYESFDDAFKDVKNGKLIGILLIAKNFSEIFLDSSLPMDERNLYATNAIDVHLDNSNFQLSYFITQQLYDAYFRFDKDYMNKTQEDYPIKVETWFADFNFDFRLSMFSAFIAG